MRTDRNGWTESAFPLCHVLCNSLSVGHKSLFPALSVLVQTRSRWCTRESIQPFTQKKLNPSRGISRSTTSFISVAILNRTKCLLVNLFSFYAGTQIYLKRLCTVSHMSLLCLSNCRPIACHQLQYPTGNLSPGNGNCEYPSFS